MVKWASDVSESMHRDSGGASSTGTFVVPSTRPTPEATSASAADSETLSRRWAHRASGPPNGPVTFTDVTERDRFFEGNPWYLLGLLAVGLAALARGQVWVVVISLAVAGVVIGAWYPIWRWRKNSRMREAKPSKKR